jgi:hypothetical protein
MAWESKLALDVVQSSFGSSVRCVAEALLELGPSSIAETSRHLLTSSGCGTGGAELAASDLPNVTRVVRAGLFVLLAHDCVACSLPVRVVGGGPGDVVSPTAAARAAAAAKKAAKLLYSEANPGGGRRKGGAAAAAAAAAALHGGEVEAIEVGSTLRYEFRPAGAVRRLRFPYYLAAVRAAAGSDAALIVEILFAHGPWTQHGLISAAVLRTASDEKIPESKFVNGHPVGVYSRFSKAFDILHKLGFVTKHEGLHHPFPSEYKASSIKLASFLSSSSIAPHLPSVISATALVEDNAATAAAIRLDVPTGSRKRPFSAIAEIDDNDIDEKEEREVVTTRIGGTSASSASAASGDGEGDLDDDIRRNLEEDRKAEAACVENGGKQTVLRFSWETGKQYLRNTAILRLVRLGSLQSEAIVKQTTLVIQAMMSVSLENVEGAGPGYRQAIMTAQLVSQPLEVSLILKKIRKLLETSSSTSSSSEINDAQKAWTYDRVFTTLMELADQKRCTAPVRAVDVDESIPLSKRTFSIMFSLATDAVQLRTVESILSERYSESSARIFRMLLEKGMLDEKYVSDKALLEPKTARMLLFKMVSDGILTSQELPRRPDRNPQHTIYLFNAHWDRVLALLADETCRSVLFLRIRLAMEKKRLETARKTGLKHMVMMSTSQNSNSSLAASSSSSSSAAAAAALSSSSKVPAKGGGGGTSSSTIVIDISDEDEDEDEDEVVAVERPALTVDEQAQALLQRMEEGVEKLETSILRIDETLFILSEL